jgi:hypothetical protein
MGKASRAKALRRAVGFDKVEKNSASTQGACKRTLTHRENQIIDMQVRAYKSLHFDKVIIYVDKDGDVACSFQTDDNFDLPSDEIPSDKIIEVRRLKGL